MCSKLDIYVFITTAWLVIKIIIGCSFLIGAVVGDNKQKQITGRVLIDNKDEYSVTAEWAKTRKGNIFIYSPYIEVVIPNKKNIKVSSTVEYVAGKSFDGEFMIEGISKQPIQSKGN